MIIAGLIFYISGFIIIWAMVGYPVSIRLIGRFLRERKLIKDYSLQPTVTVLVVAYNEEKVILEKLKNIIGLEYEPGKIEFLIASDHSTDQTNEIVKQFIEEVPDKNIRLYEVKERKGKTNAQNEAHKTVTSEFLVMTDANSMFEPNAVRELMSAFTSDDIAYVAGCLAIKNKESTEVAASEVTYWESDVAVRETEGRIQTITAGNGAIYACRTKDYYDFNPIECHDSAMPIYYALNGKRAICNHDAIAYEKAGEVMEDEFSRKVRMNRSILSRILPDLRILNVFRLKWFSYFYFGHRTCRYLLWFTHLTVFVSNIVLIPVYWIYPIVLGMQVLFYLCAFMKAFLKRNGKIPNIIYYYCMTVLAQWVGVINILTGKAKPFWEKAESTR